jgi:hypothetical protein
MGLALRTRERMVVCQLDFYKNIDRKETLDKHVRVTERKHICFIEIIKSTRKVHIFIYVLYG